MRFVAGVLLAVPTVLCVCGCATDIAANSAPAELSTNTAQMPARVQLVNDVTIPLRSGYWAANLKKDRNWTAAESIPQGTVYRPVDHPLMIEAAHRHEAYLVISNGQAVGFYLTAQRAFVAANPAQPVALREVKP
jgi:hypothetical protein